MKPVVVSIGFGGLRIVGLQGSWWKGLGPDSGLGIRVTRFLVEGIRVETCYVTQIF